MKTGIQLITEERRRQIEVKGYTHINDKEHAVGELANAASCYAMIPDIRPSELPPTQWPWLDGWKPSPKKRIRELQKAGALIAAEIDRLNNYTVNEIRTGTIEIQIKAREVCTFENFHQWVDPARSWINYDKTFERLFCIDNEGYELLIGDEFSESKSKNRFPVKVFAIGLSRTTN